MAVSPAGFAAFTLPSRRAAAATASRTRLSGSTLPKSILSIPRRLALRLEPIPAASITASAPSGMVRCGSAPPAASSGHDVRLEEPRGQQIRSRADERRGQVPIRGVTPHRRAFDGSQIRVGAASEERFHQIDIAPEHRRMQSRIAASERIGIGAVLQQQHRHMSVAAVGGEHERSDTVGLCLVRVRASLQQHPGRFSITNPRREQQRRGPAAQHRVVQLLAPCPLRLLADDGLRRR